MRFIVLSSSRGTTFGAVLERIRDGSLKAQCLGLITDRADRGCIDKARSANIPVVIVHKNPDESREEYDKRLHTALQEFSSTTNQPITNNQQLVLACMGWMWIFSPWFINQWKGRILNVHPALLPKHGGAGMYGHHVHEAVLDAKETESGATIHVMDEGVDTGKILLQKTCAVTQDDTAESLAKKVQDIEKEIYPKALQMIEEGKINL